MDHMQTSAYTAISSGVDWITATAKSGSCSLAFEHLAAEVFAQEKAGVGTVTPAIRLGYVGHSLDGFFHGRRPDGNCIVVSGQRADPLARQVTESCSNVSRLDLQVTFYCHGEQPHLGESGYAAVQRHRPKNGRPGTAQLISGWPDGETLMVNKRVSDSCGRCYDKATEASIGAPRTIWRFETEFKRKLAKHWAVRVAHHSARSTFINDVLGRWWTSKGVDWPGASGSVFPIEKPMIIGRRQPTLEWFRTNLSKTIARRVHLDGLEVVLDALGLAQLVQPVTTKEAKSNGVT